MEARQESVKVKRHHLFKGINLSETKKKELKARVEEIKKDLRQQIENKKNTEIVELKKAFAQANWKLLQRTTLTAWDVLKLFEELYLGSEDSSIRSEKYKNYTKKASISAELEAWDFTVDTFACAAADFYERLFSHCGDPILEQADDTSLCIEAEALQDSEWRVLGVLWKLLPLPSGTLARCNNSGSRTVIINDLQSLKSN
jgi:hypothetical protein